MRVSGPADRVRHRPTTSTTARAARPTARSSPIARSPGSSRMNGRGHWRIWSDPVVGRAAPDIGGAAMRIPFGVRRPWLLLRGGLTNRKHPDLVALGSIEDPDRFVWAILPHAARSFATSILMLPTDKAPTAAVAYLYCRMLDTYEDLSPPRGGRRRLAALSQPACRPWRPRRRRRPPHMTTAIARICCSSIGANWSTACSRRCHPTIRPGSSNLSRPWRPA